MSRADRRAALFFAFITSVTTAASGQETTHDQLDRCVSGPRAPIDSVSWTGTADTHAIRRAEARYTEHVRTSTGKASIPAVADIVTFYRDRRSWLYLSFQYLGSPMGATGAILTCSGAANGFEYDVAADTLGAPVVSPAVVASTTVPVPGRCETPRTGPPDAVGCYLAGTAQLGAAPATALYWHLDTYSTRAAAEAARGPRGTVVVAHGRMWLFTIAEAEWRAEGSDRVARVGPLPLTAGRVYAAHYLDGVVPAEARTPAHRHAGPEAWYVLEGTNCLETPEGVQKASAGESLIVREGLPMVLTGVGTAMRRTLTLVVHDAAQPWTIPVSDWTPKNSCQAPPPN